MSEQSSPTNNLPVSRMILAGTGIALAAIAVFGLVWFGLGQANVEPLLRLSAAVCVPPAILTVVTLGVYLARANAD